MDNNFSDDFIVKGKFSLKKVSTEYKGKISKSEGEQLLVLEKEKLRELQEELYSDGTKSLLVVIQAMDAAGKDSLIEHVFGGVNPQGCSVTSFKTPSTKEYSHDFLWRHYIALPQKGMIGIFNRSHYESVLVCKVHPEYNLSEKTWRTSKEFNSEFWKNRYESIRNFEKHLSQNGTKIVKIFLNVSKDEQKKRLIDRIDEQEKNWKFSLGDLPERALFQEYMKAYEDAINQTSTEFAPWHVLPADNKWFARLAAIQIIIDALQKMKLQYPVLSEKDKKELQKAKKQLEKE